MRPLIVCLLCGFACTVAGCGSETTIGQRRLVRVGSPNQRISAELTLQRIDGAESVPHIGVLHNGRAVILPSPLRIDLAAGTTLGANCAIQDAELTTIRETYRQYPGKRTHVVNHCSEAVVSLRECGGPPVHWQLVVRAYDEGVAYRYRFPDQDGWSELVLADERSTFRVPGDALAFALPLNGFTTSYEKRYARTRVADLPNDWLLGLPCLLELPGTGWAAITEAGLRDYAGMYLAHDTAAPDTLRSRLYPLPHEPEIAVRAPLPHDSPWRVVLFGEQIGTLIESDMLLNLNAPCAIDDVSWIKPGKTTFPWWNGYFEDRPTFEPGLNTATARHYIDFCAEAGIPYHSLDGLGNTAWYGGPIVPYEGADPTRAVDGLDLPEVLAYAKTKGVRLRLWMHWRAARAHMRRAFPLYREWGIEGVMLDFLDRDDQEMIRFMEDVLRIAAANHLTVTFHGCPKPTGLERTYPNLLTSEAVMNLEYDKWDSQGVTPEHEVTVPFTRMLAGPLDFHQGSLRTVPVAEFRPRNDAPLVLGTPCRTLASYVVFQNHLSMVADYPTAYRGHPALPVLASIPTTWDDTRFLAGSVGQYFLVARQSGGEWWIGGMTGQSPRTVNVSLGFVGNDRFNATIYKDDLTARFRFACRPALVTARDTISATLAPAGGLLVRLTPVRDEGNRSAR